MKEEDIERIEETVIRLHFSLRNKERQYDDFRELKEKLSKERVVLTKKDREALDQYHRYQYYQGKFYAYLWTLARERTELVRIIERLRGMVSVGNKIIETKTFRW